MTKRVFMNSSKARKLSTLLFACLWLFQTMAAFAGNDYYVSPSGSDSNSGTSGSPWLTIQHCVESFTLGTPTSNIGATCHVLSGSYTNIGSNGCGGVQANVCIDRGGSGTTDRLRIQCDGATFGTPITNAYTAIGKCQISGSTGRVIAVYPASNVDLLGLDIGNSPGASTGIAINAAGTSGVSTSGNSVYILNNYIHDIGSTAPGGGNSPTGCPLSGAIQNPGAPVAVYQTDTQVIGNLIVRYGAWPVSSSCGGAHGIYLTGHDIIENNIISKTGNSNIQIWGDDCTNVVSNNILLGAIGGFVTQNGEGATACPGGNPGSNTFNNNYFAAHSGAGYSAHFLNATDCTNGTPNLYGNNYSDGVGNDYQNAPIACDNAPGALSHLSPQAAFSNYNLDANLGNFAPVTGNALINGGTSSCSSSGGAVTPCVPSTDFAGNAVNSPINVASYATPPVGSPAITLSVSSLTFTATALNNPTASQTITVTSSGSSAVTFATPNSSGIASPFAYGGAGTCSNGTVLNPGATCTYTILYNASSTPASGTLTILTNGTGSNTVSLSGSVSATTSSTIAPTSLTFAALNTGGTSAAQNATDTNTGSTTLTVTTPTITGPNAADFTISSTTGCTTIAASGTCVVGVEFTPQAGHLGTLTATLNVTDTAATHTVTLTGTGTAPAVTVFPAAISCPNSIVSGTVNCGSPSITISNSGTGVMIPTSITSNDAEFVIVTASSSCYQNGNLITLNVGQSCTVLATFTPTGTGLISSTLSIAGNFTTVPVNISGTGQSAATNTVQTVLK